MVTKEIWCKRDNNRIYGMVYIPGSKGNDNVSGGVAAGSGCGTQAKTRFPLVIFSHELCHTHESGVPYAERLAAEGYAVYVYDFCGASVDSKSDGSTLEMDLNTNIADLNVVLDTAKTWDFVDPENIVLFGGSQGGVTSAIVSARRSEEIKALMLIYPAFLMSADIRNLFPVKEEIPDKFWLFDTWIEVSGDYAKAVYDYDVYSEIDKFKGPVLLLHGDSDRVVKLSYSEKARDMYRNCEYHVIPGGRHGFKREAFEMALGYIREFLKKNLRNPG